MEITPPNLQKFFTELKDLYDIGFRESSVLWPQIAERVPSSTEMNTYSWMADMPGFREWIGPRVFHNIASRTYAIVNRDWENSFEVSRNKIEDDQYGIYGKRSQLLGRNARLLWDDLVFGALQAGTTAVGYDGQYFFDTDHPVNMDDSAAGTYANNFPSTDLTNGNLTTLITTMMSYQSESGRGMDLVPNILLVPPQLAQKGHAALAPIYPASNVAMPNPLADGTFGTQMKMIVAPRLKNQPTVYYVLATQVFKPIVLQVRKEPEFVQRTNPESDNVFHRKIFEYGADARGAAGYGLPFTAIRGNTAADA
jgi:phage major head subunit gpT-like protein